MAKLEKTIVIKTDTSGAKEGLTGLEKGVQDVGKGAKNSQASILGMTLSTKALGLALKSAGIGIVISALVGLSNAFMGNQKIADSFNIGMEALSLTFKKLVNPMVEVFNAAINYSNLLELQVDQVRKVGLGIKQFLTMNLNGFMIGLKSAQLTWEKSFLGSGDTEKIEKLSNELKGLQDDAKQNRKDLVDNFKDYVEDEFKIRELQEENAEKLKNLYSSENFEGILETSKSLVRLRNEVKLADAEQRQLQLTYQKDAEIQRQIRDDISLTIDERIEANDKLGKVLEKQAETEKANAQLAVDLAQKELDQDKENIDLQVALKNAKTELIDIEERIIGQQSEQKTNENALHDERIANMAELSAIGKTELESSLNALDIEAEKRKELAQRTIQNEEELQAMLLLIEEDAQTKKDKIKADADAEAERERKAKEKEEEKAKDKAINDENEIKNAKIKAAKDTLTAIESIAGEGSKVAKAAAVSNILIDTALAISGAVKAAQSMPFPGNLAAVATGIATVMANLRTAKGILSKAGAGDGGDVSVGAVGGTPAMGGIGGTIPNINSISPDAEMQPVQAFVIENEISDAQALQEELEIQATL